eukprot:c18792_g1_i2 orf=635-1459(-)
MANPHLAFGFPAFWPPPSPSSSFAERSIGHYTNSQGILLVGEGDFSFSNALANAFGTARNVVATSLDSEDKVLASYPAAHVTLPNLINRRAVVLHEIDATRMASYELFRNIAFDRIVYNFPHAGFSGKEESKSVIKKHKVLVRLFFQNAARIVKLHGEVHVSHKVKPPYTEWKLEKQAAKGGLLLKDCCDFDPLDYPGYNNRRGEGTDCAKTFHLGACKTFKFVSEYISFLSWWFAMLLSRFLFSATSQQDVTSSVRICCSALLTRPRGLSSYA